MKTITMKTTMKVAIALPALALMTACSTTMPAATKTPASETLTDAVYDRMAPVRYTCTDDSKILVKQSINKKQVMLNATVPKINWSQQPIILNGNVADDMASYVNNSGTDLIYAWHMKEDTGVLAMKWANGEEYQVNCQLL